MIGIGFKDGELRIKVKKANGLITSGLVLENTTNQNQYFILIANKGDYKLAPAVGVGISDMLNDHDFLFWEREIALQMKLDGQKVKTVKVRDNKFSLDASYS